MKKNIIFLSLLICTLFLSWVLLYNNATSNNIVYSQARFVADFWDDSKVVWVADNIFVWEVIKELPSDNIWKGKLKITNFEVKVLYNIKWKLNWNISVWQEAWYDEKWNLLIHMWDKLLKSGEIYLFATRWEENLINLHENWKHLITIKNDKKYDDIKKIIKESSKVKDFRKAYKNEALYEWDLKITSEKNLYKNLSQREKDNFENIENGFVK